MGRFRYDLTPILIVDDLLIMRRFYDEVLKDIGFSSVFHAGNIDEARSQLALNNEIRVIITDFNMPGLNGVEFVKELSQEFCMRDLSFFLVITEDEKPVLGDALKSGISDFIIKPFTHNQIESKLRSFCVAV